MKNINLENVLAAEMDRVMEENKPMFSNAAMLEKLAFKRVSDEEQPTEIEVALTATAKESCCECEKDKKDNCKCECHKEETTKKEAEIQATPISKTAEMVNKLVALSEDLEIEGFDRLAAVSLLMAERLIAEAKAKKSPKSKSSKSKSDSKSKSNKSKMSKKDQMKKMREAKEKKEKASKKSPSKSTKTAQVATTLAPQNLNHASPGKREAELILNTLQTHFPKVRNVVQVLEVAPGMNGMEVKVRFQPGQATQAAYDTVLNVVNQLAQTNQLPANQYHVHVV